MVDTVILTNNGKALTGNKLGGLDTTNFVQWIGYTNGTTVPVAADTTLVDAESGSRIQLQLASYNTSTNVLTLTFFFGAGQGNENSGAINKVGFFTASSSGTLFAEDKFGTGVTKNAGKELQVTLSVTMTQG